MRIAGYAHLQQCQKSASRRAMATPSEATTSQQLKTASQLKAKVLPAFLNSFNPRQHAHHRYGFSARNPLVNTPRLQVAPSSKKHPNLAPFGSWPASPPKQYIPAVQRSSGRIPHTSRYCKRQRGRERSRRRATRYVYPAISERQPRHQRRGQQC